jgi:drug/metabolite transporter (DMT)-like permease
MLALTVITKGAYSEYFKDLNDEFGATLISEMLSRIVCVLFILAVYITMDIHIDESDINWKACFFVGFGVFVLGGASYTYALLLSKSPTFHVLNYFVPVMAVIWLWLAGEATISVGLFIGGTIVTLCNIYLVYAGRKAKPSEAL